MVTLAAQGAPIISVGVIDAAGTEAVIVRPDAGISSVKGLKGKKILTTANAGVNTFFPLVLRCSRWCTRFQLPSRCWWSSSHSWWLG
ncbi:MAG: ABC transporter substrate-binding protein [bacterium]